ncbi:cytochrome-c peroxidase [Stutzerimonas zhaodongensis]|uniref:cytochrome-c peroxidase n=1 Tax=Stutzerimonas zhaodongensis TaxID=1176257 RepID=UPI00210443DC|nr:cytochrome-c peroxidase [Stutzerimonas zhaodongensis]MCQ2031012.1 cytochrome-c peroxidase [Stutzerimonas zhaodongensis]
MRPSLSVLISGLMLMTQVAAANDLRDRANAIFKPIPDKVTEVRGKAVSAEQAQLGHKLWFDPRLSRSHVISCNTCHNLSLGGGDNVTTSIGHGWQKGPRNSPTVLNAVFNAAQFWDGRAEDLQAQAKGPVQAGVEMNNTPERVVATLKSIPEYASEFKKAFPGEQDPVSFDNMAYALEAFEVSLTTPDSPFDRYLKGDDKALDAKQKEGLALFMDTGCSACHSGVNVGGQGYFPFGVIKKPGAEILPSGDKGRFTVTNTASDEYVFRAAPLRNVALTPPYFHSGEVWDLEQAVAIMGDSQLGRTLKEDEAGAIAAFLRSLTGRQPLVTYPVLPASTPDTPRPE